MNYRRLKAILIFVAILMITVMIQGGSGATAYARGLASVSAAIDVATIPTAFSYQGTLRKADGNLATGSFNITLKIFSVVTGGTALHSETFNNVVVRNGNFSVVVGDATAIAPTVFNNANLYIGISVAPDAEMLPRQRLFPVPWAMQAASAQTAISAQTATLATTANTLIANAVIPGQLTIDRGAANVGNSKWPALLLSSNGDGYGSALYFRNVNGNQNWTIYPDPAGSLRIDDQNNTHHYLEINQGGFIKVATDLHIDGTTFAANIQGLRFAASNGFNGTCVVNAFNQGVVGNNLNVTCNQDVAETFATDQRTEPGDLVVMIPEDRTHPAVRLSTQPQEGAIVGVVSTNPGLVFDQGKSSLAGDNANLITPNKTVVAMVGRVPAKFSLENGPIQVGDPLTSSSTPGVAMKATQAGQIIGYAMQSSEAAKGATLMVWLQVGLYLPSAALDAINNGVLNNSGQPTMTDSSAATPTVAQLKAQIADLSAQLAKLSDQVANLPAAQK